MHEPFFASLPYLKLTYHRKIDPWKWRFLLETTFFRGYLSFRECRIWHFQAEAGSTPNVDICWAQVILPARLSSFLWNRKRRAEYFFNVGADMYGTSGETQIISLDFWVRFCATVLLSQVLWTSRRYLVWWCVFLQIFCSVISS